jgi:archaellum biogenesis ATPase FlaH
VNEHKILKAALSRELWGKINEYGTESILTATSEIFLKEIERAYSVDEKAQSLDLEIVVQNLVRQYPKHKEDITSYGRVIDSAELPSPKLLVDELRLSKLHSVKHELASELVNRRQSSRVVELWEKYRTLANGELIDGREGAKHYTGSDFDGLVSGACGSGKIRLLPPSLDAHIGRGLSPGHYMLVFGRPNVGKTAFLVNLVRGFCLQGLRTLYWGNEEHVGVIAVRLVQSLTGRSQRDVESNPQASVELAEKYTKLIVLTDASGCSLAELNQAVEEVKPSILVVDQLRGLSTEGDGGIFQLEKLCFSMRNLAKKYGMVVVATNQAHVTAEGKRILWMNDLEGSKTTVQGTLDLMLGIGASHDDLGTPMRTLSIVKNKLSGVSRPLATRFDFDKMRID